MTDKLAKILPFRKPASPDADTLPDEEEVPSDAEPSLNVSKRAMRLVLGTLNRWQEEHPDEVVRQGKDGLYGIAPRGSEGPVETVLKADVVEIKNLQGSGPDSETVADTPTDPGADVTDPDPTPGDAQ